MKNWSQIIDFESLNYIEVRGSQGFIAGAKFVESNPTMIPAVAELVEAVKHAEKRLRFTEKNYNFESDITFNKIELALKNISKGESDE